MRNSTFLSTVIIIIVLSQCFQANAWRRRRRRRSPVIKPPVIKPPSPKFVPAPRNPSGIPLCKGEIDVNQILQRGASGRKKRSVKRQVSVLDTSARLARLAGLTRECVGNNILTTLKGADDMSQASQVSQADSCHEYLF